MAKSEKPAVRRRFLPEEPPPDFFSSGCTLLDCVLGGGWARGRISNIVGDKAVGKTLLVIEAIANFHRRFPKGRKEFRESESAFDEQFAESLGMPIAAVDFYDGNLDTVEVWFEDLDKSLAKKGPAFHALDSLDALSDRAELKRELDEASYGAGKAKALSQVFRRSVGKIETADMHLMIVSQIRDNIGVSFGRKYKRSGGHALDFYASQVIYLAQVSTINKTINKVKRQIGVTVKAKNTKNKCGMPYRECTFDILFGFGIDDVGSNIYWLDEIGKLKLAGDIVKIGKANDMALDIADMAPVEYKKAASELALIVKREWDAIEAGFAPTRRKYE